MCPKYVIFLKKGLDERAGVQIPSRAEICFESLAPPCQLGHNEYADHTELAGRLDDKGERTGNPSLD